MGDLPFSQGFKIMMENNMQTMRTETFSATITSRSSLVTIQFVWQVTDHSAHSYSYVFFRQKSTVGSSIGL